MALAYTAPTWVNGGGIGISASQLQALSDCMEGLVQGSDKAITDISIDGQTITFTFADGTIETSTMTGLKGISSISKTGTAGNVDTYTITYTDGTSTTFTVTNGTPPTITITATADNLSLDNPTVTVTKTGTDNAPNYDMAFSGLKGPQGEQGETGNDGVSPEVTITNIPGGHRINITDADHPTGQDFDVMDGQGSGDMKASVYDANSAVANAGGIKDYFDSRVDSALSSSSQNPVENQVVTTALATKADQSLLAPIQTTLTASKAYAVGEQFVYSGLLYKVTQAIASGGTIIIDTNAELAPSVTEQIGWKLAGQATGNTEISLPSNFNELLVEVDYQGDGVVCSTIHVIRQMLATTKRNYREGYEWTAQYYGSVQVDISLTYVKTIGVSMNGNSTLTSAITKVYYR